MPNERPPRPSTGLSPILAWPSIAAAIAAVLGMGSCGYTFDHMSGLAMSAVAVAIVVVVFGALVRIARPPADIKHGERAIIVAAAVAWCASVATGVWVGRGNDKGVGGEVGAGVGAFLGAVIGGVVFFLGHVLWLERPMKRRR